MNIEDKIKEMPILRGDILTTPCIFCDYSGARYWQRHSHKQGCPWYKVGGSKERQEIIQKIPLIRQLKGQIKVSGR